MTDLVVFGASCVVVGLAVGILIGLWAPPPRRRETRQPEHPQPRHLAIVPPPPMLYDWAKDAS